MSFGVPFKTLTRHRLLIHLEGLGVEMETHGTAQIDRDGPWQHGRGLLEGGRKSEGRRQYSDGKSCTKSLSPQISVTNAECLFFVEVKLGALSDKQVRILR